MFVSFEELLSEIVCLSSFPFFIASSVALAIFSMPAHARLISAEIPADIAADANDETIVFPIVNTAEPNDETIVFPTVDAVEPKPLKLVEALFVA